MALISQTPLALRRKGIGGRLDPGIGTAIPAKPPSKPPVYIPRPRPAPVYVPPASQPVHAGPVTENDRLTIFEETLLDPVIRPEPTPEEAKLTRLEQQLDPLIPPEPTREQVGTEARWVLERVPQRPHLEFNLQGSNPPARPQSSPDPSPGEPELLPVPSILSDPVGWFQATLINAGRKNENAREVMTATLAPAADSLKSIADPERNPRIAALHHGLVNGIDAWRGIRHMTGFTVDYTVNAVRDGRWEDAQRGGAALLEEAWTLTRYEGEAVGRAIWAIVTTPVRIFVHDIPEFAGAIDERMDGMDRAWDVIFTGTMLAGDVSATYAMSNAAGITPRINAAAEARLNPQSVRVADILMPDGEPIGIAGTSEAIRELPGGLRAAEQMFEQLSAGGRDVSPAGYEGTLIELPDGGYIGLRPVSKSGPPTIDVNLPEFVMKLKFP